jgi:hypothetical protein
MSRHADLMDAAGYWRQFPVTVSWDVPKEIVGDVQALDEYRRPGGEYVPKITLLQKDGSVAIIVGPPARLLEALKEACPAVGDRIRIRYTGESERAAFGLNKTKEFTVEVRRAGSPPRGQDVETSGEAIDVDGGSEVGT